MVQKHNLGHRKVSRAAGEFVDQKREWDRKNGTLPIGRGEGGSKGKRLKKKNLSRVGGQEQASSVQGPDIYLIVWNHGFVAFWSREKDCTWRLQYDGGQACLGMLEASFLLPPQTSTCIFRRLGEGRGCSEAEMVIVRGSSSLSATDPSRILMHHPLSPTSQCPCHP